MLRKNFHHHFLPHLHEDPPSSFDESGDFGRASGKQHPAHLVGLWALVVYLQLTVVLVGGLYLIKLKAPQILGTAAFGADQIIQLTNKKRAENGLGALSANGELSQAAVAKAANMFGENYWAHNAPSGKTPWNFISAAGYRYVYAGENLARDFGDASSVVEAWMNSPSHRSNLLDANFKEIGVAVSFGSLTGREGTLVVQMFGSPVSQIPSSQNLALASPPSQAAASPTLVSGKQQVSPKPVVNLASPVPSPVPSPTPAASPSQSAQIAQTPVVGNSQQQATVLASRRFAIGKFASLGLVAFIFGLFVLEIVLTLKKSHLKMRSGIVAHALALGFLLFAIWYSVGGAIL